MNFTSIKTKASIVNLLVLFIFLLMALKIANADVLDSQTPILPQDMVAQMGSGIDVTWSEVNSKIEAYNTQATVDFANKGFKHFRLRVANDDVNAITLFLDKQIQDSLDNGVIPIIANQSHSFEDDPTAQTQADWVQWWADMASHYKDYPYELMFDLIIEIAASSPLSDEPITQLNAAYEQAVTAIRATGGNNAKRIIIFSAHKRSDATKMHLLNIPSQGNGYLIGEFHEGYASGPSIDPSNPHYYWYGSDEEIKLMTDRADAAVAWSTSTGIPIWEGAWMPGNYNKGNDYDVNRQIAFLTDFITVLNERNIPHAVNATKKFYEVETNQWNELETVVDAIMALQPAINTAPSFVTDTLVKSPVKAGEHYNENLSSDASDAQSSNLIFTKKTGSAWLVISENGALSGTPTNSDIGVNSFAIEVADEAGLTDSAILEISVSEKIALPSVEPEQPSSSGGSYGLLLLFMMISSAVRCKWL